jgi:hypothetical protein
LGFTFAWYKNTLTMLTKEKYLAIAESKWADLEKLQEEGDFLAYEERFEQVMIELSQLVLQANIGKLGNDRRKKTEFGPDSAP